MRNFAKNPSSMLVILALLAIPAMCQTRPFVSGQFGASTMGYESPLVSGTLGVESYSAHALLSVSVSGGMSRKIETGDGESLNISGFALYRYKHFLAGPGLTFGKQFTSSWEKQRYQFQAFAGFDGAKGRVLIGWQGAGNDTRNGNRSLLANSELNIGNHWRWTQSWATSWFHETDYPPTKYIGATFYTGVKYLF